MAKNQGMQFLLPTVPPAPRICCTISIPSDQASISNFIGALGLLSVWNNYRRDSAHKGAVAAQVWKEIIQSIEFTNCSPTPLPDGDCGGCDDMCCLRVNNGVIEKLECGVWTAIPGGDLSAIVGKGVQQPPPGGSLDLNETMCYDVTLYGSNVFNLPIPVSSGYIIEITGATGGWSDGDNVGILPAQWSCPNGSAYALGACGAANGLEGGDPLPTVDHMRLIAAVDGVYQDAYNQTITIGPGVTDASVIFQANDPTLSNNLGSITFKVCVTNNVAETFHQEWDFVDQSGGWQSRSVAEFGGSCGPSITPYVLGSGWRVWRCVAHPTSYTNIERVFSSRSISGVSVTFYTDDALNSSSDAELYMTVAGTPVLIDSLPGPFAGGNHTLTGSGLWGDVTDIYLRVALDSGTATSTTIAATLDGYGTNPF